MTDALQSIRDALEEYHSRCGDPLHHRQRMAPLWKIGLRLFDRQCMPYHFTASAWVLDEKHENVCLIRHPTLGTWIQPGGHADGDPHLPLVALKEGLEETGLSSLRLASSMVFDFDITPIPAIGSVPAHAHLDVRFVVVAARHERPRRTFESLPTEWVPLHNVNRITQDSGIRRMAARSLSIDK
jgi:8-oxo-dGTP pyrophosphatase MutT (NUDIX family)